MAKHRKSSAKKNRMRAGEFAVAAFLGLAVTAAPAIAAADTTGTPSTGPSSDNDSSTNPAGTASVKTGPKTAKTGKTGAGTGTPVGIQVSDEDDDEIDADADVEVDDAETNAEAGDSADPITGEVPPVIEADKDATTPELPQQPAGAPTLENGGTPAGVQVTETETEADKAAGIPTVVANGGSLFSAAALNTADTLSITAEEADEPATTLPPEAFTPPPRQLDWLKYPEVEGFTETEVAAVVFVALASLTASAAVTVPLLALPLLFLAAVAYAKLQEVGTNYLATGTSQQTGQLLLTYTGTLTINNPDGDPLLMVVTEQGDKGLAVVLPDGTWAYTPTNILDPGEHTDTFVVTMDDSLGIRNHPHAPWGHSSTVTVTVTWTGTEILNGWPEFDQEATVTSIDSETGVVEGVSHATDPNGDTVTYSGVSVLGANLVVRADGSFTYSPTDEARHNAASDLAQALGLDKDLITITASDGKGGFALTTLTVTLETINTPPTVTVVHGGTEPITGLITGTFEVDDPDGDIPVYSPVGITTDRGGIVVVTPLGYTYLPSVSARLQGGTDTFTVTANDLHGGTTEVTVTVTIASNNTAPIPTVTVALPDSDGIVRGTVGAEDINGDTLTFSLVNASNPSGATANSSITAGGGIVQMNSDGTFTYIPKPATGLFPGLNTDTFYVTVSDGNGGVATATVTILSHLQIDTGVTSNAGGVVKGKLNIDKPENVGLLTYSVGNQPTKGSVTVNADGTYTYTTSITTHANATDEFTIVGTDTYGRSVTVATVEVTPVLPNTAPNSTVATTIGNKSQVLGINYVNGSVTGTDPDGDTVTFTPGVFTTSKGGVVTVQADGSFNFVSGIGDAHAAAAVGATAAAKADTFSVTAVDGFGGSTTVQVSVPLDGWNANPTKGTVGTGGVQRDAYLKSGNWITTVLDTDGDPISWTVTTVTKGTVTVSAASVSGGAAMTVTYTSYTTPKIPIPFVQTGVKAPSETFTITFRDGFGGTVTETYTF